MIDAFFVFPFELSIIKVEATSELAVEKGHMALYGTDSGLYRDPNTALKHLVANVDDRLKGHVMKKYKRYK